MRRQILIAAATLLAGRTIETVSQRDIENAVALAKKIFAEVHKQVPDEDAELISKWIE